jgi:hypothetical protein
MSLSHRRLFAVISDATDVVSRNQMARRTFNKKRPLVRTRCEGCLKIWLSLEVDAAQDNAGRTSFELHCQEFATSTLFNLVA